MTDTAFTIDPADEDAPSGALLAALADEPAAARGVGYNADLAAAYAAHAEYLAAGAPEGHWEAFACLDVLRVHADTARRMVDFEEGHRTYNEGWARDLQTTTGLPVPVPDNSEALASNLAATVEQAATILTRLQTLREEGWPDADQTSAWEWVETTIGRLPEATMHGCIVRNPAPDTDQPTITIRRHLHGGVRITLDLTYDASLRAVDALVDTFDL